MLTVCPCPLQLLAKSRGLEWAKFRRLGDLQNELRLEFGEMEALVRSVLHEEPYSKKEVGIGGRQRTCDDFTSQCSEASRN